MIDSFDGEFAFLSNFYNSPIVLDGEILQPIESTTLVAAPTVEHAFQAAKTCRFDEAMDILKAEIPGAAKRLGRKCQLREDWEEVKDDVMLSLLRIKFSDPGLALKLLATGDEELIEGSWWHDQTWGSCYCEKHKNILGENKLGKLLMRIRKELKLG